jgi:predicted transcriptional regulator
MPQFTITLDDEQAQTIQNMARRLGKTPEEVIVQELTLTTKVSAFNERRHGPSANPDDGKP